MERKNCFWMVLGYLFLTAVLLVGTRCYGGELIKSSCFVDANTDDPDLLMYLPFDGTVKATVAQGNLIPKRYNGKVAMEVDFAEGKFGQIIVFGEDTLCYSHNHAHWNQGTIEMWVKLNFDPKEKVEKDIYHYLLRMDMAGTKKEDKEKKVMYIFIKQDSKWNYANLNFATKIAGKWSYSPTLNISALGWSKDEWHHVAISWDNNKKYMFVDNKKIGEVELKDIAIVASGKKIVIGGHSGRGYWGENLMFNGCVDEVLIWKKVKSQRVNIALSCIQYSE